MARRSQSKRRSPDHHQKSRNQREMIEVEIVKEKEIGMVDLIIGAERLTPEGQGEMRGAIEIAETIEEMTETGIESEATEIGIEETIVTNAHLGVIAIEIMVAAAMATAEIEIDIMVEGQDPDQAIQH